jgi:hypothetical protein
MNKYKIKVSDKTFREYVEFTNKNINDIENLVKNINSNGLWCTDFPMLFTTDDNFGEVSIYKQKAEIFYKYTHVASNPYEKITDRYKIIYKNDNERDITDELTGNELIELLEKDAIMTEYGIIGMTHDSVKKMIESL